MPDATQDLKRALRELYQLPGFEPRAWTDPADPAYLAVHLIERSVALLAPQLRGEVLDVGCGQRPYAAYFRHVTRLRGCDHDRQRGRADFVCLADRVPLEDGSLDGILCTEVLEHVPDPASVWREFGRLLRPQGKVLLATPMYWPGHEEPRDFYRYTEFGLRHLATQAGFGVLALYPRGGRWAFAGQVFQHCVFHHAIPQRLRFRWLGRLLNGLFLRMDRRSCNVQLTLGWTVLATKP